MISRNYTIETEQEADGRWIAEIPELPGALVYADTEEQAKIKVEALAFKVLAEELENAPILERKSFKSVQFSMAWVSGQVEKRG